MDDVQPELSMLYLQVPEDVVALSRTVLGVPVHARVGAVIA